MKLYKLSGNMNATVVELNDKITVLFSYKTPVAAFISGRGFVKTETLWSRTTSKHINLFHKQTGGTVSTEPQEFFDKLVKGGRPT